ncbi:MAG: rhodanese-like domain-containing protein [Janthinobacterium lividum]
MTSTPAAFATINATTLANWLTDAQEIALIDVREEGESGLGHPLFALNIPYSRLERDIEIPVPRRATRIVLLDGGDAQRAHLAARRLTAHGYTELSILEGGAAAWQAAGQPLFHGVNVPSKAFAEFVEHAYDTPQLDPAELAAAQANDPQLIVLDCRTPEEFERFHVPGAISAPGADLLHWVDPYIGDGTRPIVVSCAGRTRGIIGAQALINAGVRNPVYALRGGTQAWRLAGFELAAGAGPLPPVETSLSAAAQARSRHLAAAFDVRWIDAERLRAWQADTSRTTYLFDVRQAAEYQAGHLRGSVHAPGGQLVQTTDRWIGTRNARVVLVDPLQLRAVVTAHWLQQLGVDVVVLKEPFAGQSLERGTVAHQFNGPWAGNNEIGGEGDKGGKALVPIDVHAAAQALRDGVPAVVFNASADFRKAHPEGAYWANRARLDALAEHFRDSARILLFGEDETSAQLAAIDLHERFPGAVLNLVQGGLPAWRAAGLPQVATPDTPADADRIDYLFWAHDRHDGNLAAIAEYLAWEAQLPTQIGDQANAAFRLPTHA